jgi:hypothetical protein
MSGYLPFDLMTTDRKGSRRLKVNASPRVEATGVAGVTFVGISSRNGVSVGETYDSVIVTGDKWVVIEDVIVTIDFSSVTTGNFTHEIAASIDKSNGNNWTYTPESPVPAGRPINSLYINNFGLTTIDLGVTIPDYTGTSDYPVFFEDYYVDTQGNRSQVSSTGASFFATGKVILCPNSEILVRSISSGSATGTANIRTIFFLTELTDNQIGLTTT